jgi:putative transposase
LAHKTALLTLESLDNPILVCHNLIAMSYQVSYIKYHMLWGSKFGRPVLVGDIALRLDVLIREEVAALEGSLCELKIDSSSVYVSVEMPPQWSPAQIAYRIKRGCSTVLRREFPQLRSRLPSLWNRSQLIWTTGSDLSESARRNYLEQQRRESLNAAASRR